MNLLEFYDGVDPRTQRFAVVGTPLAHSVSPLIHRAAFQALGMKAVYQAVEVAETDWPDFLDQAKTLPLAGFNVTLPFKQRVAAAFAGSPTDQWVSLAGAVNTVRRTPQGWSLHNTDVGGFLEDLKAQGEPLQGRGVVLLGAGGAARAVLAGLGCSQVGWVAVINRTPANAVRMITEMRIAAQGMSWQVPLRVLEPREGAEEIPRAGLIINATSLGVVQGEPLIDSALLHPGQTVYDLVYRDTDLLVQARARGARTLSGIGMLVRQAAKAFEIWFERPAPMDVMAQAAQKCLSGRSA